MMDESMEATIRPPTSSTRLRRTRPKLLIATGSVSVLLHLWAASHQAHDPWMQAAMASMGIICIPCLIALRRNDARGSLRMMIVISSISAVFHLGMLATMARWPHPNAHHTTAANYSLQTPDQAGSRISLALVSATEVSLIFLSAERWTARRAPAEAIGSTAAPERH